MWHYKTGDTLTSYRYRECVNRLELKKRKSGKGESLYLALNRHITGENSGKTTKVGSYSEVFKLKT